MSAIGRVEHFEQAIELGFEGGEAVLDRPGFGLIAGGRFVVARGVGTVAFLVFR